MESSYPKIELVEFMEFWRWEYLRRNKAWKNILAKQLTEGSDEESPGVIFYTINIDNYMDAILADEIEKRWYSNSDDIISDIVNKLFCYKKPFCDAGNDRFNGWRRYWLYMGDNEYDENEDFNIFKCKCNKGFEDIKKRLSVDYEKGDRIFVFNINDSTNLLLNYIDMERTRAFELSRAAKENDANPVRCANLITYSHYEKFREIQIKEKSPRVGKWKNNEQRAVGLWLYDYCTEHNCGGPTAFAALRRTKYLEGLGLVKEKENDRSLERWLAGTKACVEAAEVLPLTG